VTACTGFERATPDAAPAAAAADGLDAPAGSNLDSADIPKNGL
jgi:hypothetical protein